ncbi:hypothetical protein [Halopiger goleimassiliensis]|uniref:hypothetical protein n=1 Tax=Halopiger goleimassiliensis TaxID=1293048 RepID=UPI0006776639|nr:hypothetical protein [Halopiger goleimassiliensis]
MTGFVPASQLYDVESRTPIAHPAHQVTDADVRGAVEKREVRTDGGGTNRLVDSDECERCDATVPATRRLCSDCAREVRKARGGPL